MSQKLLYSNVLFIIGRIRKEFFKSIVERQSAITDSSQSDLAARLQVAGIIIERDSISRIEIGTRFVADYELRELSRILNVSVAWLLGIEE